MQVQVLKSFQGDRRFQSGDILDADGWVPNRLRQMVKQRYVQVVVPSELKRGRGRPRKRPEA